MNLPKHPAAMTPEELRIREDVRLERERRIKERVKNILGHEADLEELILDNSKEVAREIGRIYHHRDIDIQETIKCLQRLARKQAEEQIEVTPEDL